jgi:MOSC domain-containing protein YiiM
MTGRVDVIHLAPAESAPLQPRDAVTAIAGRGLDGDRYATGVGHYSDGGDGRALTLIESEVLEALAAGGITLAPGASRRNVTTSGIRLNDLVGRRFRVGPVECLGVRLCEPCVYLAGLVGQPVVAPLVHRGGLRADILVGGVIRVGDPIVALPQPARSDVTDAADTDAATGRTPALTATRETT